MRLDKYDVYTAKEILRYRGKNHTFQLQEEQQRERKIKEGQETNNQSSPIRRKREEPMKEQNRVNEEKDRNTQRQETEVVTVREKVGERAIKKVITQPPEEKDIQKYENQKIGKEKTIEERNMKTENTFIVLQEENTEPLLEEEEPLQLTKYIKIKKKAIEGKGRGRIRKIQSKRKGESGMGPKPGLPKKNPNEGITLFLVTINDILRELGNGMDGSFFADEIKRIESRAL